MSTRSPATPVQLSTQRSLGEALKLRVPVSVDEVELTGTLQTERCPSCHAPHLQLTQDFKLRPGGDRWPAAEAVLMLVFVLLTFGPMLASWSIADRAFDVWPWTGWILVTLTSAAVLVVSTVRGVLTLATTPLKVEIRSCSRCEINRLEKRARAEKVDWAFAAITLLTFVVAVGGFAFGPECWSMQECRVQNLDVGLFLANQVFLVFWIALFGRFAYWFARTRRDPALRRRKDGRVELFVPPSWLPAFDKLRSSSTR